MTHTPGPWRVMPQSQCNNYRVINPAGDAELGNWTIAEKVWWFENARLIAAAPDLLAALRSADEWMACVNPALMDGKPFKLDRERVRAAIAKATGGP